MIADLEILQLYAAAKKEAETSRDAVIQAACAEDERACRQARALYADGIREAQAKLRAANDPLPVERRRHMDAVFAVHDEAIASAQQTRREFYVAIAAAIKDALHASRSALEAAILRYGEEHPIVQPLDDMFLIERAAAYAREDALSDTVEQNYKEAIASADRKKNDEINLICLEDEAKAAPALEAFNASKKVLEEVRNQTLNRAAEAMELAVRDALATELAAQKERLAIWTLFLEASELARGELQG